MTVSMQYWTKSGEINWKTTAGFWEIEEALFMWEDGFDTYDIAQALHIYEAVIYAKLPQWRGKA